MRRSEVSAAGGLLASDCRRRRSSELTWSQVSHGVGQTSSLHFGDEGAETAGLRHLSSNHLEKSSHEEPSCSASLGLT